MIARWLTGRVYWTCSRFGMAAYRRFPIFGRLRGAIAIVESGGKYLVIQRNDGLGICFPGGMAKRGEPPLDTVLREFREETGLLLREPEELFQFDCDQRIPATTVVFRGKAEGELRSSWEGTPCWFSLDEIARRGVFAPHKAVLDYLVKTDVSTACRRGR